MILSTYSEYRVDEADLRWRERVESRRDANRGSVVFIGNWRIALAESLM